MSTPVSIPSELCSLSFVVGHASGKQSIVFKDAAIWKGQRGHAKVVEDLRTFHSLLVTYNPLKDDSLLLRQSL